MVSTANAQTYTWQGTSTNWTNGDNWKVSNYLTNDKSDQVYPTSCANVLIETVDSGLYPSLTTGVNIRSLSFEGEGRLTFGTGANITYRVPVASTINNVSLISNKVIFGKTYIVNADLGSPHALSKSSNECSPIYRFEVRPNDRWDPDIGLQSERDANGFAFAGKGNGNYVPTGWKTRERSELKSDAAGDAEFGRDIWISYSMYIEPGANIVYKNSENKDNPDWVCIIGQWHQNFNRNTVPFDISLRDEGTLNFRARKGTLNDSDFVGNPCSVTRGEWHHILINVNFAKQVSGGSRLKIWVDGATNLNPVVNETDLTHGFAFDEDGNVLDRQPGYWKFGIYRVANAVTTAIRYANVEVVTDGSSLERRKTNPLPVHD
jgi:hypothetical protein